MLRPYKNRDSYPEITKEGLDTMSESAQRRNENISPSLPLFPSFSR
jgi:hypothetical protein